ELMKNSSDFFVYERINNDEKLLVIANFKEKPCKFKAPKGYDLEKGELVFYNYEENPVDNNSFTTRPYELRVYKF
ncbi:MAG: glucohydrolase, partial [Clostridia bacterium]|nr:glucohydrolase [Clostridia bacterium]